MTNLEEMRREVDKGEREGGESEVREGGLEGGNVEFS